MYVDDYVLVELDRQFNSSSFQKCKKKLYNIQPWHKVEFLTSTAISVFSDITSCCAACMCIYTYMQHNTGIAESQKQLISYCTCNISSSYIVYIHTILQLLIYCGGSYIYGERGLGRWDPRTVKIRCGEGSVRRWVPVAMCGCRKQEDTEDAG